MAIWTKQNKSNDPTWQKYTRRGSDATLGELGNFDFTEAISEDGDPKLGDARIDSFSSASQPWSKQNKSAAPTWTKQNQS